MPSVIKLVTAVAMRKQKFARFSRENVFIRDSYTCQYCGFHGNYKELTLDHVLPASKGGPKSWDNIVTACGPCNTKKADKTIREARMKLLREPYQPKWTPKIAVKLKDLDPVAWNNYVTY
jgi:5-methylcytosine-specific restriction endonuclease McrA